MGQAPNWTTDELEYLQDKWGVFSIARIAAKLGRSVEGVKLKASRTGLGDNRLCIDGITLNQFSLAINTSYSIVKSWVRQYGFPAKKVVLAQTRQCLIVKYEDFWKWAAKYRYLINFARIEPLTLGNEPQWVAEKRKADEMSFNKIQERPWSKEDDAKLKGLVHAYRFTYPEIAKELRRSEAAVKRRLYDLSIKARPVRLNNHIKWTDEEVKLMLDMFHKGYGYNTMSERLGKSALGIRGKLERMGFKFQGTGGQVVNGQLQTIQTR